MKLITLVLLMSFLASCGEQHNTPPTAKVENAEADEVGQPTSLSDHNYAMKDGYEYGYEQAISENQQNAGQAAATLLMFRYSGQKDGVFQAYSKQNKYLTMVVECANPCEWIKVMEYVKDLGVTKTERLRATPGTIAYGVIEDAINGKLEQYVGETEGKKFTIWLSQKKPEITYLK